MKLKLGMAFAAAMFAASFTVNTAQAYDWTEFQQCMRECRQTYRLCLQYVADHWYMHRGHLADARRAAGLARSGF